MIRLNIDYDPEIPDEWQNAMRAQALHYEAEATLPRPRWPYSQGAVTLLGVRFERRSHRTRGVDPWSGESWTARIWKLTIRLSDLVCDEGEISWGARRIVRICQTDPKRMPAGWRFLWNFLESRYQWWERQTPDEDYQ